MGPIRDDEGAVIGGMMVCCDVTHEAIPAWPATPVDRTPLPA